MCGKRLILLSLLLGLLAGIPAPAAAAPRNGSRAALSVQATVLPWLKVDTVQHVDRFQVSAEDVARGYTDLKSAVTVNYQTNIQEQIFLQVAALGSEEILVQQPGFMTSEVVIPRTSAGTVPAALSLDLRVVLAPETVAGSYPLRLSIIPTVL